MTTSSSGRLPVQRASRGEHLCGLFRDEEEQRRLAAAFAASALGAGDRLVYLAAGAGDRERLGRMLDEVSADAAAAMRAGQIVVTDLAARFDRIFGGLRAEAERARADGYPGLRVTAEMQDAVALLGSVEELVRWERDCTRTMSEQGIIGLCQYGPGALPEAAYRRVADAHIAIAEDDGGRPLAVLTAPSPSALRVAGEIDLASAGLLSEALAARADGGTAIELDLSALDFIGLAGLDAIRGVAEAAAARILVRGLPAPARRLVDVVGWTSPYVEMLPE